MMTTYFKARRMLWLLLPAVLLFLSLNSSTDASIVGSDFLADSIIQLDETTGVGGAIGTLNPFGFVQGLAYDSNTDTLYGTDTLSIPGGGQLIRINPTTGSAVAVGGLGLTSINGLAFDPISSTLYGSRSNGDLVTVNTSTGAATTTGSTGFSNVFGLAFDPITGTLYGSTLFDATSPNHLIKIDTVTGVGTAIGPLGFEQVGGLAFDAVANVLYGVDDAQNQLITINTSTGAGTSVAGPFTLGFDGTQGLAVIAPSAVPEPSAMALFALCGLIAGCRRRA